LWLLDTTQELVLFIRWLNTKLTIPGFSERENDMIAHVRRQDQGGKPWAIPVEFQVEPDPLMFGRFLVYEGLIWLLEKPTEHPGDRFNLIGLVVNLTGIGTTGQDMAWTEGKGTGIQPIERNLQTFKASNALDQIAAGKAPRAALALIPLMIGGGEPGIMHRWLEVAQPETDEQWRGDFCLAQVFAELTGCQEGWKTALEGFNVRQSAVVNEWKAEAKVEAKIEGIRGLLAARLGGVPADIAAKLAETHDLAVLQTWLILAGQAPTLDAFRKEAGMGSARETPAG
jgi:hypothetical protein